MPPKDDDDPASTKEVVTKKQKQLLNREELNLAAIAEAFDGLLLEAPAKKGSGKGSDLPFKEPEPDPVSKKDAKKLQRMTRSSGSAAERIQRGLESQGKLSRTRKTRSSAQPPAPTPEPTPAQPSSEKYPKSDPRKAVINYATEVETRGVAGGRRTPEQVKLSPDEIAKRTRAVRDTFAAADRGDKKALDKVKEYQRGYDAKYGEGEGRTGPRRTRERTLRTGRTVRTRSSADTGLRDMQGRKGQAPLDPELQRAASRRAGQVPDEPTVGKPTVKKGEAARARARGQAQAQGAGRAGRGSSGRTGRQILRSLVGKEADIERIKSEIDAKEKRQAERRRVGQVRRQQTLTRKDTATRIGAQNTPEVRRTPKVGGPAGGYRAPAQPTPGNVARQAQVPKGEMTRIRARTTPSAQPRGASGGDAGAAARTRLTTKQATTKPKLPQWMQDFRRGAEAGRTKVTSRIPAAAYLVPGVNKLATAATIGATIGQGVGELQRSSQERALKKLPTTKTKPGTTISYAPDNNPRMYPGAIKQLTKAQLAALTPQQKYMSQAQYDRSIAGTDLEIKTATATAGATAPPTTKVKTKTGDPKDPKTTSPVKTLPIPVVKPPVAKRPTIGQGNKTGRKVPGPGLPRIGLPGYRGKIGRRSNPQ